MYSLKAIFDKEPVAIAGALRSVLFVLVLAGLLVMDEKMLAAIALGAEVLLGLFVRQASTSVSHPTLPRDTEVKVEGTEEVSIV